MTSPDGKYATASKIDISDFDNFECSLRTTAIDYPAIKKAASALFGSSQVAIGFAIKLNLHGLKIKSDDYIKIKGTVTLISELVEKMRKQPGYVASKASKDGADISIGKSLVTPIRLARAFASEVTVLIKGGKIAAPEDLVKFGNGELPAHYCFLAAAYGMTNKDLKDNAVGLMTFARNFDLIIDTAVKEGWVTNAVSKRSHETELVNYLEFRGFSLD